MNEQLGHYTELHKIRVEKQQNYRKEKRKMQCLNCHKFQNCMCLTKEISIDDKIKLSRFVTD